MGKPSHRTFGNAVISSSGWSPNPLGLGGKPAPFECKRRNELRDYKRVFANDRRSFLGWSPNPLGLGGKPAPFKCKRRVNCATTNAFLLMIDNHSEMIRRYTHIARTELKRWACGTVYYKHSAPTGLKRLGVPRFL